MADAPASGGGGWGALEIIVVIILAIGLIATLTGTPITPLVGTTPAAKKTTAKTASDEYTISGCTASITNPRKNQQIDNSVIIEGDITNCLSGDITPVDFNAQVTDSKGAILSLVTPIDVNKNIFGDVHFSAVVPLSGTALSTSATVTLTGTTSAKKAITIRVPIKLTPGSASAATAPAASAVPIETNQAYYAPAPAATSTTTTTTTNNTGTSSNTF